MKKVPGRRWRVAVGWWRGGVALGALACLLQLGGASPWAEDPLGLVQAGLAPGDGRPLRVGQVGPGQATASTLLLVQAQGGAALMEEATRRHTAEALLRASLAEPEVPALRLALAEQLSRLGEGARAEAVLARWTPSPGDEAPWAMVRAAVAMAKEAPREALPWLELALRLRPRWADAWLRLAEAQLKLGDRPAAARARREAEACPSLGAEACHVLGTAALDLEDRPAKAVGHLERAWALAPGRSSTANNLGNAYHALNASASAALWYHRAAAADPSNPQPLNGLGVLHQEGQRWPQALQAFRQAIARDARCFEAWYNVGLTLKRLRRPAEAEEAWRRARALRPSHPAWRRAARTE